MKKVLFILIIVVVATLAAVFAYPTPSKTPVITTEPAKDCTFSEPELLTAINSVRANKVLSDPYLDKIAQDRANIMPFELDSHAGFRKLGDSGSFDRYARVSEILASNHCGSDEQLFLQWSWSKPHWDSINNEEHDVVGIGYNLQGTGVVIFGDLN